MTKPSTHKKERRTTVAEVYAFEAGYHCAKLEILHFARNAKNLKALIKKVENIKL